MSFGSDAVHFWYQACKRRGEHGKHPLSLESKFLDIFLKSDLDAHGAGFLSVSLTKEQDKEARKLYRVLFLVFQDPDALELYIFTR